MKNVCVKLKKISRILLICTLILGLLAGSCGVAVTALDKDKTPVADATPNGGNGGNSGNGGASGGEDTITSPLEGYEDATNELLLNANVKMLTEAESKFINDAVLEVRHEHDIWDDDYMEIKLAGNYQTFPATLRDCGIMFIHGDASSPWGSDRFIKVLRCSGYGDTTTLRVQEPTADEVFSSMDIATSQALTAENLVNATFLPGVNAYYEGQDHAVLESAAAKNKPVEEPPVEEPPAEEVIPEEESGNVDVDLLAASSDHQAVSLGIHTNQTENNVIQTDAEVEVDKGNKGVEFEVKDGDLIITLDVKFKTDEEEDKKKDEDSFVEADLDFGIKGAFSLNDLTAHLVCEMPSIGQFEQLYFGVSGEQVLNIHTYGKFTGKAEPKATEKDLWLLTLEGLNEKRFPLAVFQFQGTTPVYITNAQYESQKEAILPQLYLVLYANWEGEISLELTAGFAYSRGFNNGLRVIKDGQPCLVMENHPYPTAYNGDVESFDWNVDLTLTAHTDLTLFGGSVLFYVAGINIGEVGVLRLGFEAEGSVNITLSSDDTEEPVEGSLYLRGYLKILEVNVKLGVKDTIWGGDDFEIGFSFTLLEFELFRLGTQPDKYIPKMPISTMPTPDAFESVITLVCDVSGSMDSKVGTGETKLAAAKSAAKTIVTSTAGWAQTLDDNYGFGVIMFADSATQVTVPHIDYPYIEACIDTMGDGGGTCIYSGIDAATIQLDAVNAKEKVIILMTDGQDYQTRTAQESTRAAVEKGITLYTIGFGNDVDEDFLQELAEIGNGEYRFADTENVLGILKGFMSTQQSANGEILSEVEGTVSQGETTEAETFTVDDQQGNLMVYTAWPGSFLDTILIDPNGREVDEEYPNVIIDKSSIPTSIIVQNPIPGKWKTKIVGVETSYDNEPYFTLVSFMETEPKPLNEPMETKQKAAAYGMAIGFPVALISLLLLICLRKKAEE